MVTVVAQTLTRKKIVTYETVCARHALAPAAQSADLANSV